MHKELHDDLNVIKIIHKFLYFVISVGVALLCFS